MLQKCEALKKKRLIVNGFDFFSKCCKQAAKKRCKQASSVIVNEILVSYFPSHRHIPDLLLCC
jgi:hypothetical protein